MLPESGRKVPKSKTTLNGKELANRVGSALRDELGSSRRATKTVMGWADVCDRAARTWIQGEGGLSGAHLLMLARHSDAIWLVILELVARPEAALSLDVHRVEVALARAQGSIEAVKRQSAIGAGRGRHS
jgi:hypothetical protein